MKVCTYANSKFKIDKLKYKWKDENEEQDCLRPVSRLQLVEFYITYQYTFKILLNGCQLPSDKP